MFRFDQHERYNIMILTNHFEFIANDEGTNTSVCHQGF